MGISHTGTTTHGDVSPPKQALTRNAEGAAKKRKSSGDVVATGGLVRGTFLGSLQSCFLTVCLATKGLIRDYPALLAPSDTVIEILPARSF